MCEQIKSKQRVADHGEVFTNEREVKAMCDLVGDEVKKIDSTVLEPACGEGNFLIEILSRKLETVRELYANTKAKYDLNSVIAVSSLYGVDILGDNVTICRQNLFNLWQDAYIQTIGEKPEKKLRDTVSRILELNIIRGNTLSTKLVNDDTNDTDEPIVFSEWKFTDRGYVFRIENRYDTMLGEDNPQDGLSLFAMFQDAGSKWQRDPQTGHYAPIIHERVHYKEVGSND